MFAVMILCFGANGATLRTGKLSTVKLCNNGYTTDRENCTSYAAGNCGSGYYTVLGDNDSFGSPINERCQTTYKKIAVPENMYPIFSGTLITGNLSTVKLCNNGYTTDRDSCTNYAAGDNCRSGYFAVLGGADSFGAPINERCQTTYKKMVIPTEFYPIFSGTLITGKLSTVTLCDNGYTTDRSDCVTYTQNDCPDNYQDLNVGETTFAAQTNNSCASGYRSFVAEDTCRWKNDASYCVHICGAGQYMTSLEQCSELCGAGVTTLRTSTGLVLPVWATKQITPSLNIGLGEDVCYVNLVPGNTNDHALMFNINGTVYHSVE